jgi:hypothetical protein
MQIAIDDVFDPEQGFKINGVVRPISSLRNNVKVPEANNGNYQHVSVIEIEEGLLPGENSLQVTWNNYGGMDTGFRLEISAIPELPYRVSNLYSTGVSDTGAILPDGSIDTHWKAVLKAGEVINEPMKVMRTFQGTQWEKYRSAKSTWIGFEGVPSTGNYSAITKFNFTTGVTPSTSTPWIGNL